MATPGKPQQVDEKDKPQNKPPVEGELHIYALANFINARVTNIVWGSTDADKDGKLSMEEFAAKIASLSAKDQEAFASIQPVFEELLKKHEGKVPHTEIGKAYTLEYLKAALQMDADKNGSLSTQEVAAGIAGAKTDKPEHSLPSINIPQLKRNTQFLKDLAQALEANGGDVKKSVAEVESKYAPSPAGAVSTKPGLDLMRNLYINALIPKELFEELQSSEKVSLESIRKITSTGLIADKVVEELEKKDTNKDGFLTPAELAKSPEKSEEKSPAK